MVLRRDLYLDCVWRIVKRCEGNNVDYSLTMPQVCCFISTTVLLFLTPKLQPDHFWSVEVFRQKTHCVSINISQISTPWKSTSCSIEISSSTWHKIHREWVTIHQYKSSWQSDKGVKLERHTLHITTRTLWDKKNKKASLMYIRSCHFKGLSNLNIFRNCAINKITQRIPTWGVIAPPARTPSENCIALRGLTTKTMQRTLPSSAPFSFLWLLDKKGGFPRNIVKNHEQWGRFACTFPTFLVGRPAIMSPKTLEPQGPEPHLIKL